MTARRLRRLGSWPAIAAMLCMAVAVGTAVDATDAGVTHVCRPGFVHELVRGRHLCRPAADLRLTVSASPTATRVGGRTTYVVTVANRGRLRAERVVVRVVGAVEGVSASASRGSCPSQAGSLRLTCSLGALAPGSRAVLTIVARATAEGTVSISARATSPTRDSRPRDNASAITIRVTPPDSVRGRGSRPIVNDPTPGFVVVEVDASGAPDGGQPTGTFLTRYGPTTEIRGTVVCLTVVANRASVGGIVEQSNEPAFPVGSGVLLAFTDGGPGRDTQLSFANQPNPRACPVPLFDNPFPEIAIDSGDFVIVDGPP